MNFCGLTNCTLTHQSVSTLSLISKLQTYHSFSNTAISISTFKTSEKHFFKRHYIPQQIFHHLLIHQSQKLAKHFSSYKILMLNLYSLYLCLPYCLSSFSLAVCLSVCLSLSFTLVFWCLSFPLYTRRTLSQIYTQSLYLLIDRNTHIQQNTT